MRKIAGSLEFTATDLVGFLNCRYLSYLELAVVEGARSEPDVWDPMLQLLWERGSAHEADYVASLTQAGLDVVRIDRADVAANAEAQTLAAMKDGVSIIVQGSFSNAGWTGRPDILRRAEVPSALGSWSYEAIDTKLARETKAGTILQLCLYSDLIQAAQGVAPEYMYVVPPWSDFQPQQYRFADYAAYFRKAKRELLLAHSTEPDATAYPEPTAHCEICHWRVECDQRRREDDHLCLVAWITKVQINELRQRGVTTVKGLASLPVPLAWKPARGSIESYTRIREQARLQVEARESGLRKFELLPIEVGFGLARLPEPSAGDVFLDFEGDPFVGEHPGLAQQGTESGLVEYFRLSDLSADDLLDERAGLSGLTYVKTVGGKASNPIHRYSFPPQETELRGGEVLKNQGGASPDTVESISITDCTIDIKKRRDTANVHPTAAFSHNVVTAPEQANSLLRIGEFVAAHGLCNDGQYLPARDLLLRASPRLRGAVIREAGETTLQAAIRLSAHLDGGFFPIQGPPGAGKTYTGARMICELVRRGKTVGITANSHKVIRNLIDKVIEAADELGVDLHCCHKAAEPEERQHRLCFAGSNEELLQALGGSVSVGGGTAWLWARQEAFEAVDVLFVDEAAQMSLANVLAVSQAAKTVVLIGDPQQLDQPMQGSHPDGTDVSALAHILGGEQTIPTDRGLFLEQTWRLYPSICEFTSELFYGGKLKSKPGLEGQTIKSSGRVSGSGLRYLPVAHTGNQNCSPEEASAIGDLIKGILANGATWVDGDGVAQPLTLNDIMIITPYNAQVFEIQQRLPGARVGTVDKFQGQQAPIAIYSMATSSHADAPRGMEFLYSLNRLNVATSRARCMSILVSSPQIFEAECRAPRQIQLANAFCRYLEMAEPIEELDNLSV